MGVAFMAHAQESLLGDIMNVSPVAAAETSNNEEALADYQIVFDKRKSELDDDLASLGEDYKKEVVDLIQDFTKTLSKGVAKEVKNEKQTVITKVNSLTIQLRKNKQSRVTQFGNRVAPEIRDLPIDLRQEKQKEMRTISKEYYNTFDDEYSANQAVISQFKNTQHLMQIEGEGI